MKLMVPFGGCEEPMVSNLRARTTTVQDAHRRGVAELACKATTASSLVDEQGSIGGGGEALAAACIV